MAILRIILVPFAVATLLTLTCAQQSSTSTHEPVLDVTSMDRSVDPCVDFFAYSCGGWIKNNPIPPDQSSWDTYSKMQDENLARLRGILEEASLPNASRNAVTQKIGDYYASCMDEKAVDAKGADPLKPGLERIAKLNSKTDIADVAASMIDAERPLPFRLHPGLPRCQPGHRRRRSGWPRPPRPRLLHQGRREVVKSSATAYVAHVQKMFELLGDRPDSRRSRGRQPSCASKPRSPRPP